MDFKQFFHSLRHLNAIAYQASLVNSLKAENQELRQSLDELSEWCRRTNAKSKIIRQQDRRKKNLPVRVAFLCENPEMWKAFREIVYEMEADPRFEVILIRLRCKGLRKDWMDKFSFPDYESVDPVCAAKMIDAYDEKTDTWLDIETLHPEYVFYMRPYESVRHGLHRISRVSQFAKTCYVPYGVSLMNGEVEKINSPENFCSRLDFFFASTRHEVKLIRERLGDVIHMDDKHLVYHGYLAMDKYKNQMPDKPQKHEPFTICWMPRWNIYEENCHFFEYKDVLFDYAKEKEKTHLILRPHPKCFSYFVSTNLMTQTELDIFKAQYDAADFAQIDESGDYLPTFEASDVMVADETSMIAEFYPTLKPIILCKRKTHFAPLMEKLSQGIYMASNKKELYDLLEMLRNGDDPLREKRRELALAYQFDYPGTVAKNIVEAVYEDATDIALFE